MAFVGTLTKRMEVGPAPLLPGQWLFSDCQRLIGENSFCILLS